MTVLLMITAGLYLVLWTSDDSLTDDNHRAIFFVLGQQCIASKNVLY